MKYLVSLPFQGSSIFQYLIDNGMTYRDQLRHRFSSRSGLKLWDVRASLSSFTCLSPRSLMMSSMRWGCVNMISSVLFRSILTPKISSRSPSSVICNFASLIALNLLPDLDALELPGLSHQYKVHTSLFLDKEAFVMF